MTDSRLPSLMTAAVAAATVLWLLAPGPAAGESRDPLPNPPEPTAADVLRQAKLDDRDPIAVLAHLGTLLDGDPALVDVWVPTLRQREYERFVAAAGELEARAGRRAAAGAFPGMLADLQAARLRHPARVADAALRRLEDVGTLDQVAALMKAAVRARTAWGRWKCFATVQGILSRSPAADAAKRCPLTPALALLLRDLPAPKRGELAAAFYRGRPRTYDGGWPAASVQASLWLAWALSGTDPEAAVSIFRLGLELPDPAVRLFAGLGIARVTDDRIPFRLTANRRATAADRAAWLANLAPHPADDWHFPGPLARPVVRRQGLGPQARADLWWLAADGSADRRQEDVWPGVIRVLPDGTCYSVQSEESENEAIGVTDADGEVLVRFPFGRRQIDNASPEGHGGLLALEDYATRLVEYAATGEVLWACPTPEGNGSARDAGWAGPGRVLLLRYGRVEVLNRRGDVVWSVGEGLDDPRWACAIDPDTLLVACKTAVEVHHRTRGRLRRVGGFTSVSAVRYHPTKPWVVFDAGNSCVVLQAGRGGAGVKVRLDGPSGSPTISRWVRPVQLHPATQWEFNPP